MPSQMSNGRKWPSTIPGGNWCRWNPAFNGVWSSIVWTAAGIALAQRSWPSPPGLQTWPTMASIAAVARWMPDQQINDADPGKRRHRHLARDGPQYVQLDCGNPQAIDQVRVWHLYDDGRRYRDVIIQLSNDPAFKRDVTTVFNNDLDNSAGNGRGAIPSIRNRSAARQSNVLP